MEQTEIKEQTFEQAVKPLMKWLCENKGLTKREYFAGLAMQGLLASNTEGKAIGFPIDFEQFAKESVKQADALLAELEKQQ